MGGLNWHLFTTCSATTTLTDDIIVMHWPTILSRTIAVHGNAKKTQATFVRTQRTTRGDRHVICVWDRPESKRKLTQINNMHFVYFKASKYFRQSYQSSIKKVYIDVIVGKFYK